MQDMYDVLVIQPGMLYFTLSVYVLCRWSFAVTLWEIWTYGQLPFAHLSNEEVIEAASLDPNCTLEQPKDCQVEV